MFFFIIIIQSVCLFSLAPSHSLAIFKKTKELIEKQKNFFLYHQDQAEYFIQQAQHLIFDIDDTLVSISPYDQTLLHKIQVLCEYILYKKNILFITSSHAQQQYANQFIPKIKLALQQKKLKTPAHRRIAFIFPHTSLIYDENEGDFILWKEFNELKNNHSSSHIDRLNTFKNSIQSIVTYALRRHLSSFPHSIKFLISPSSVRCYVYINHVKCSSLLPSRKVLNGQTTLYTNSLQLPIFSRTASILKKFVNQVENNTLPFMLEGMTFTRLCYDNYIQFSWSSYTKRSFFQMAQPLLNIEDNELCVYCGDFFSDLTGTLGDSSMIGLPHVVNVSVDPNSYFLWSNSPESNAKKKLFSFFGPSLSNEHIGKFLLPRGRLLLKFKSTSVIWEILFDVISQLRPPLPSFQEPQHSEPLPLIPTSYENSTLFSKFA